MKSSKKLHKVLTRKPKKVKHPPRPMLSTGCTLLNLAIADRVSGALRAGGYYYLVGDSQSGKSFLSMTCFAEACASKMFNKYNLYYDNIEDGMHMDVVRLFGSKVAKRLEPPERDSKGRPVFSDTIESFYYHLWDAIGRGPCIYVLDSMDALSSEAETSAFNANKKAHEKGKEAKGSYGDGKAKKNSEHLRKVLKGLRKTGSILIVVSQTRDNLNPMAFGERKTRSGGRALRFYANVEMWSSVMGAYKKQVRGKDRKIGTRIKIQIVKNRITGKLAEVETVIYPSFGIDDAGSCVDYLVSEGWWKKRGPTITAPALDFIGSRESLIHKCEEQRDVLLKETKRCWISIQRESAIERKARYE